MNQPLFSITNGNPAEEDVAALSAVLLQLRTATERETTSKERRAERAPLRHVQFY
ncbi:acyl-CoA carboxylase subunit epsilon [Corynebacterium lizhenjunii]|uniref:Acyl-CoA carboxylase subunit epsilon n=1 Tax=Corynebacterium lizhenjunii TaxID=2709394 RepID=A0A7T0KDS1_9CORY|nr:acyl-CoA carboxylase subunit epsilon [Corynebacterium lizhenjunii]QPK78712.1 acyl-CoA carboxylase subunit epsilon [Corynebacterium lizhenjunii]